MRGALSFDTVMTPCSPLPLQAELLAELQQLAVFLIKRDLPRDARRARLRAASPSTHSRAGSSRPRRSPRPTAPCSAEYVRADDRLRVGAGRAAQRGTAVPARSAATVLRKIAQVAQIQPAPAGRAAFKQHERESGARPWRGRGSSRAYSGEIFAREHPFAETIGHGAAAIPAHIGSAAALDRLAGGADGVILHLFVGEVEHQPAADADGAAPRDLHQVLRTGTAQLAVLRDRFRFDADADAAPPARRFAPRFSAAERRSRRARFAAAAPPPYPPSRTSSCGERAFAATERRSSSAPAAFAAAANDARVRRQSAAASLDSRRGALLFPTCPPPIWLPTNACILLQSASSSGAKQTTASGEQKLSPGCKIQPKAKSFMPTSRRERPPPTASTSLWLPE